MNFQPLVNIRKIASFVEKDKYSNFVQIRKMMETMGEIQILSRCGALNTLSVKENIGYSRLENIARLPFYSLPYARSLLRRVKQ